MLISERIYKYMEEKKISQIEFSRRTGITQSTVSDWRRKGTNPSADKIMIICEVLGITPYELLLDTDNKKMKEYKEIDHVVLNKDSKEYALIENYQKLDLNAQRQLEGYMNALIDMK